jgi:hypothetical protein
MQEDKATQSKKQLEIVEELQLLWLNHMKTLLENGLATSTDLATLSRFLMQNGWTLDPAKLPEALRSKLTSPIPDDSEMEDNILPFRQAK